MDPLLIAIIVGIVAFVIIRGVFRVIHMGLNLLLLIVIVVVAYLLLRGG